MNPNYTDQKSFVILLDQLFQTQGLSQEARDIAIAQAGVETTFGMSGSAPSVNNFWNITTGPSWQGSSVAGADTDAVGNPITQKWRSYPTPTDGVTGYITFLSRTTPIPGHTATYAQAWTQLLAGNVRGFTDTLYAAGYYTKDPTAYYNMIVARIAVVENYLGTAPNEATQDDSRNSPSTAPVKSKPALEAMASSPLQVVQQYKADLAGKNINRNSAPRQQKIADVPVLPTTVQQAWQPKPGLIFKRDEAYPKSQFLNIPVTCVTIDNQYVEKFTAYDFLLMRKAAFNTGLWLGIVSCFRTWESQERLFYERLDPQVRAVKGYASPPGWGHHHTGTAIDIAVGMTIAQRAAGQLNDIFTWLAENADLFGFFVDRVEPWHWEHKDYKLFGRPDSTDTFAVLQNMGITADAAVDKGQPDYARFLARDRYEQVMSYGRSLQMIQTSRGTLMANGSASNLLDSASTAAYSSTMQQHGMSVESPTAFDPVSLNPFVFNFTKGLWGDETES